MIIKFVISCLISTCLFWGLPASADPAADCRNDYKIAPNKFQVNAPPNTFVTKSADPKILYKGYQTCTAIVFKKNLKCPVFWTIKTTPPSSWRLLDKGECAIP